MSKTGITGGSSGSKPKKNKQQQQQQKKKKNRLMTNFVIFFCTTLLLNERDKPVLLLPHVSTFMRGKGIHQILGTCHVSGEVDDVTTFLLPSFTSASFRSGSSSPLPIVSFPRTSHTAFAEPTSGTVLVPTLIDQSAHATGPAAVGSSGFITSHPWTIIMVTPATKHRN